MFKIRKQANLHIKKNNQLFLLDKLLYRLSFVSKLRRFSLSPAYNNFCAKQYKNRSRLLQTAFPDYISQTLLNFSIPTLFFLKTNSSIAPFLVLNSIFKQFFNSNTWLFSNFQLNFNYFFDKLLYMFHGRNIDPTLVKMIFSFLSSKLINKNLLLIKSVFTNNINCISRFYFFKNFRIQLNSNKDLVLSNFKFSNYKNWSVLLDVFFKTYKEYVVKFNLQPRYYPVVTKTTNHLYFQSVQQNSHSAVLAALS